MIRRRKPKRRGYVRPSRAKPKTGWSLRELAQLSGVSARAIREYFQRGLLPRPPFKGPATRYERRQLVLLLAIRRLLSTEKLTLAAVRARLQALTPAEIETFATELLEAGLLATALGVQPKPAQPAEAGPPKLAPHVPRWAHIDLALGLVLQVREDASDRVLELAKRLCDIALPSA